MKSEQLTGGNPLVAKEAVFHKSQPAPEGSLEIRGHDFNSGVDMSRMLRESYRRTGFQATALSTAIDIVNDMREYCGDGEEDLAKCEIFLGFTSNLMSSGLRETFRYLTEHKMVDVVVSSAGGIEEDFIKCLAPTYLLGTFNANGEKLRSDGLNRIGNLIVPNDNYCLFEDWIMPILDQMLIEQNGQGVKWTPSRVIHRLGKEINDPESVYYWCYKNDIPVYCPALTDGSLGDMIFFHSFRNPGLVIDIVEDIRGINRHAMYAKRSGMIILGGGVIKHHICNANLMRNGADYAVFINTGQEFDGSDAGASPEEAVSWGKVKSTARRVKICADATLIFPLLVAETFAKQR